MSTSNTEMISLHLRSHLYPLLGTHSQTLFLGLAVLWVVPEDAGHLMLFPFILLGEFGRFHLSP